MFDSGARVGIVAIGAGLLGFIGGRMHASGKSDDVVMVADGAVHKMSVDGHVNDSEMAPYVCGNCGENFEYTHAAPEECPHCGKKAMIPTT